MYPIGATEKADPDPPNCAKYSASLSGLDVSKKPDAVTVPSFRPAIYVLLDVEKVDVSTTSEVSEKDTSVNVLDKFVLSSITTASFPCVNVGIIQLPPKPRFQELKDRLL